jgi:PIN domain nuclease of toxin-antitoxin system
MTVYVLDSSAILRYIDNETGADRVRAILVEGLQSSARLYLSAVQWGEIAGKLYKRLGAEGQSSGMNILLLSRAEIIPADADYAVRAARLKVDHGISYADAFALDLAMSSPDHVLVTADYGFKSVETLARIEFLPVK